ncbi:MAG TPA: 3'(2'),5'-bisphosphate nucleotidase CysQ [Burkholderiaceae bacterium]|nr:3'(2'),5'-bisphosphate nucleotidase CysQ [Burkholderiaceae bacterium]
MTQPLDDAELAALAAEQAGQLLLALRADSGLRGDELGRAGDAQANAAIVALLQQHRPDDALLSEEQPADEARLQRPRVWIVDPLDGTREYGEPGARTDWAVHVALVSDGVPTACAVALPGLKQLWRSDRVRPLPAAYAGRPRIMVSRTRPPPVADALAQRLGAQLLRIGSAGAKAMAVLRGDAELYVHAGGMNEWDSCAPVGVALAHGLVACRFDGSPCRYNQPDPKTPDLLIGSAHWVEQARALLASL